MGPPRESLRLPLLAGWLFADLMLLLFILSLSFAPIETVGPVKPTPTPTPSPTPTVSPPVIPQQRVLEQRYYKVTVNVPLPELQSGAPGSAPARELISGTDAQIAMLVAKYPSLRGKRVGVAVIFGAGPIDAINAATAEAGTAGAILRAADPEFSEASTLPLWTQGDSSSFVNIIVFFYAS